jgi:heat shock protein HtpX
LKRALLFIATNILVIATISIITSALGLHGYLSAHGINYYRLAMFCLIWGVSGSIISLLLSKFIAKMAMGVVIIHPKNATREERFLLEIIQQLSQKAGLKTMPEVGIYSSPELNAFATGPSKQHALIAVSSGLLNGMNRDEIEAVLGHELSHIANGDMVTMTLIQGIINSFSLFFSRIAAYLLSLTLARNSERSNEISYLTYSILTFVFDMLFTLFGSMLVALFSRRREFRADSGGAALVGQGNMIAALKRLQNTSQIEDDHAPSLSALKISSHPHWLNLFSTHPPLEKRIARLQLMKSPSGLH